MIALAADLLRWYDANRRRLPWRETPSPYRTWVSEIMLQQTQVAAVLPYYDRFLRRFPDVRTLADAPEAEVLRLWAGLGYYSRARNLKRAAETMVAEHGGRFPDGYEDVLDLPGVGRYTAGAILSIAFGKPYPVLDGNVMRVFARLFALDGDPKSGKVQKEMWALAEDLVDRRRPGDWNQALMELGALICVPESPRCWECPLKPRCKAFAQGLQDELPRTAAKRGPVSLQWTCLWVERGGEVLLWKRSEAERFLPGHWALPEARHLKGSAVAGPALGAVRHAITHHKIALLVRRGKLKAKTLPAAAKWLPKDKAKESLVSSLWLKACRLAGV